MSSLFDKTTNALQTAIDMRQIKHNLTASNIANAETPGYKAKKIDFEDALARALDLDGTRGLSTSSPDHFQTGGANPNVRPDIYDNPEGAVNNDGNSVDLEKEMSALSENAVLYKAALQLINKKMAALKYAASETK
jgi:flagellar basal-body rod protein FlgB